VAGVAHHAGTKSAQAQANEQAQNQQLADLEAQNAAMQQQLAQQQAMAAPPPPAYAPPAPPAPPVAAPATDVVGQLKQLADLKAAGVLSDAEFEAAKAKLLG
jgi:multidrug resistance efflux pump